MEEEQKTLNPRLYHSLSPHSICKKSPNLLAALLLLPDPSLEQCRGGCSPVSELAVPSRFLRRSGLRKNALNPVKPALAKNVLNLNVRVRARNKSVSQGFIANWPHHVYQTLTQRTHVIPEMLSVNHTSFLWYASLFKLNPIKAHWERGLTPFSSERLVSLSSPSRSCLGRLILIRGGWGSSVGRSSPTRWHGLFEASATLRIKMTLWQRSWYTMC